MTEDGIQFFIATVSAHFPRPKFGGDEIMERAWINSMRRQLSFYDDDILADAAERILSERKPKTDGRFFPVPSECAEICNRVRSERRQMEAPLLLAAPERSYEEKVALARDLMQSPIGQDARREGWGQSMFYFCVTHARAPSGAEVLECKRSARDFRAAYDQCLRGNHPLGAPLARLAESIVEKAKRMMA